MLDGDRVFGAHIDEAFAGPHSVGADDHPLDHQMRVALQERAVHEGPRVALVGIADDVLGLPAGCPHELPLAPSGEACTASSSQARIEDLLDDGLRRQR